MLRKLRSIPARLLSQLHQALTLSQLLGQRLPRMAHPLQELLTVKLLRVILVSLIKANIIRKLTDLNDSLKPRQRLLNRVIRLAA